MKICWDNLEGIHLTRNGTFAKGRETYVYRDSCTKCGDPYLTIRSKQSKFCSQSCAVSGENNPFFGKTSTIENRQKMSEFSSTNIGILSPNWKGGVTNRQRLTIYTTYNERLGLYEDIRKQEDTELLEVKCTYCNRWYTPTYVSVNDRLRAINNLNRGEQRLYCSENCKQACPTYNKQKYPKEFKHTSSREVSTYLRQMVLERDNWECQICGKTTEEIQLHVHHMDPATQNPMFQNDADSCITLCKDCHKKVHKQHGCRYIDLRCNGKQ